MEGKWNPIGSQFLCFLVLVLGLQIQGSWSLNHEGLVLLEFQARVTSDPFSAFANWNPHDNDPCLWFGVYCVNSEVQMLDLYGLSLEGTLAPELGQLICLRSLILRNNNFFGSIPEEFGGLTKLELLDLRDNNLSETIPAEIGRLPSLKQLLLCDNKFQDNIPLEMGRPNLLSESQFDENLPSAAATGIGCINRKLGHQDRMWQNSLKLLNTADSLIIPIKSAFAHFLNLYPLQMIKLRKDSLHGCQDNCYDKPASSSEQVAQNVEISVNFARRKLFEQSSNLPAAAATVVPASQQIIALPTTKSSGTFPAILNPPVPPVSPATNAPSALNPTDPLADGNKWMYFLLIPIVLVLVTVLLGLLLMCRKKGVTTIGPWKTGLSGQLQKAFVTGVPKLNKSELETACEDFSNIIDTFDGCIVYKGTLSSGVEIAVASTSVSCLKDWSKSSETRYRRKIDVLSRVNHKNFVNLIGFCEENEPFNRMMVFEYAPNGSLFEHLHVQEMEHLDWNTRMRIIMGIAYCLQYMHHDLNPPVAHTHLCSQAIYLTDDYAAKIAEICFITLKQSKSKNIGDDESEHHSELPSSADPETNIYSFGILLLEIISGKLPYSDEQGPLEKWAAQYLSDKRSISCMIDPSLKSFKNEELDVICEVIQECIKPDPRQQLTMRDIVSKLRGVIHITPEQATPRLSPLWWAELEILSVEAT